MDGFHETQDMMLNDSVRQLVNDVLVWIGFGTVVGLLAKGIMPGRDPGGAIATVLMGIGGTVMGCGVLSYFRAGERVVPVSPLGMFVGIGGTLLILFFYKLLGGYYFVEGEYVTRAHRRRRRYGRRRRYSPAIYED
ncbi:MAG: GlsB/YeaQ/YmgE family stress response membrane protein [Pirellulales bacterium]|nr:GlsB/YeaQ/YmgE family stress response membrane protein [Pirellulales bacterium]